MYVKLNGPPIGDFDFSYAVQLWLHVGDHKVGASALTSTLQRQAALKVQQFPWGSSEIPDCLRAEVSSDDEPDDSDASLPDSDAPEHKVEPEESEESEPELARANNSEPAPAPARANNSEPAPAPARANNSEPAPVPANKSLEKEKKTNRAVDFDARYFGQGAAPPEKKQKKKKRKSKDAGQNTRKTKKKKTRNEVAADDLAVIIDALPSKETPSEYGRQRSSCPPNSSQRQATQCGLEHRE